MTSSNGIKHRLLTMLKPRLSTKQTAYVAIICLALSLNTTYLISAQSAPETLEDILTAITKNNLQLAQLHAQQLQFSTKKKAGFSEFLPSVSLLYDKSHSDLRGSRRLSNLQLNPESTDELFLDPINSHSIKASLRQPIFDLTLFNQIQIEATHAKIVDTLIQKNQNDLFSNALYLFYDVITGTQSAHYLELKVATLEKIVDRHSLELTGNLVKREAYLDAKVQLVNAQRDLYNQYQKNKLSKMELNRLMNRPLKTPLTVTDNAEISDHFKSQLDQVGLLDTLYQHDPQLSEYELESALAKQNWNALRATRIPKVYFETLYGYTDDTGIRTDDDMYSDYSWRVAASMPIFNGFKSVFDKQLWQEKQEEIQLKIQQRKKEVEYAFTELTYMLEHLKNQLKVNKQDTQLFEEKLAATKEKQALGQATPQETEWAYVQLMERRVAEQKTAFDIKRITRLIDIQLNTAITITK